MLSIMESLGDDPRALFIRFCLSGDEMVSMRRAVELGYAPAKSMFAMYCSDAVEGFAWAEDAAAQGDRQGLFLVGWGLWNGRGCTKDRTRAVTLWKEAAELEHRDAQFYFGELAYSAGDWQRYHWWGRAAAHGNEYVIAHLCFRAVKAVRRRKGGWPRGVRDWVCVPRACGCGG